MRDTRKRQDINKTLVIDYKVQVVDAKLRLQKLADAHAIYIPEDMNLNQGDQNIAPGRSILLREIQSVIIISSFSAFTINMSNSEGQISGIRCNGLFIMEAPMDHIEIIAIGNEKTRVAYIYA